MATVISHAQEYTKNYDDAFKLIDVWLDAQKDFENIPSITAVIVKDQKILWKGAFGASNLEQKINATTSTIGSICSMTKSFTAVAIMKLADEGKLNLTDKVKDILPFYKTKQLFPSGGAVTVQSLLSHASGLPGNTGHSYFTRPSFNFPSQSAFRTIFKGMETKNAVGSDFNYSNVGYALLGEIIAEITGISYEDYLINEVIHPLKMTSTHFEIKPRHANQAVGYTAINRNRTREQVATFNTKSMQPAMGLWTSINDLATYASWQFRVRAGSKNEILTPSTLKKMHSTQVVSKDKNTTWGLGFEVIKGANGDHWISHGGTCPGFVSLLQLNLTTKMGFAIMINANRSYTFKYLNGIKQIMNKVTPIKEGIKNVAYLNDYIGYYNMNPWNSMVYVSTWGEGLVVLQLPENSPKYGMMFYKHVKGDTFRFIKNNGELGAEFIFERDKKGKVFRYFEGGNYKNRMTD